MTFDHIVGLVTAVASVAALLLAFVDLDLIRRDEGQIRELQDGAARSGDGDGPPPSETVDSEGVE